VRPLSAVDISKYEILYDLPEGEYNGAEVGGIRTKTIRAGDSLEVECFPILRVSQEARRERKRRESSAAQKRLNDKRAERKMCRLLETNFHNGDIVLHPTFATGQIEHGFFNKAQLRKEWEEAGLPMCDDDARKKIRNFVRACKARIKRRGGDPKEFKYIYVMETTKEPRDGDIDPLPARYHFHMVISSMGILTIDDVNELWQHGYCKAEPLDFRFNGLEPLAKYITKQRRGKRKWASSKNLKKPDEKISNRKISKRRANAIADDMHGCAKEIMEKIYPGYVLENAEVKYSAFIAGAYIYARMR
jgi:hypothetical protein